MKFVAKPLVETADISRGRQPRREVIRNVLLVVGTLAALYFLLGLLGELLARTIPDRWERQMAVLTPMLEDRSGISLERPRAILEKLRQGEVLRDLSYTLFVFDHDLPNAVAVPGGGIGLTPALLEMVESEAGLAFVLAHELGHHQHRDILLQLGRRLLLSLAGSLLFDSSGLPEVNTAFGAAETVFSRRQERAADRFALEIVVRKYGGAGDALEFFEKISQSRHEDLWRKYLGSHPLTRERMAELRALAAEMEQGASPRRE